MIYKGSQAERINLEKARAWLATENQMDHENLKDIATPCKC